MWHKLNRDNQSYLKQYLNTVVGGVNVITPIPYIAKLTYDYIS